MNIKEFIENGAALEHNRWASWQKYLHSLCKKNADGSLLIPKDRVARWERQLKTSYSDLSEEEKEFDRIEVRKYLPFLPKQISIKERLYRKTLEAFVKDNYAFDKGGGFCLDCNVYTPKGKKKAHKKKCFTGKVERILAI